MYLYGVEGELSRVHSNLFLDGPVNKVRYGAVAKQLSEYLVFVVCFVTPTV